jgi:hypothetical protein
LAIGGGGKFNLCRKRQHQHFSTLFKEFFMSLGERLQEYISACFTGLWIQSHEHEDALREVTQLCRAQDWRLAIWDVENGLQIPGHELGPATDAGGNDPLTAIRSVNALAASDSSAILVLINAHRFLQSAEVVQALIKQITVGKQNRTFVAILAPVVQIPPELEKLFTVIEHDLPNHEQLAEIARGVATEAEELPTDQEFHCLLDAAAGLTRYEAENAFSLSLVRHRRLESDTIWQLKGETLKKSGLLTLHRGGERFTDLGGLEALKDFCLKALRPREPAAPKARGIVLLGPPGTGKSATAKALGNETHRPTLILDPGSLMASLVGQTEERTRQALKIIDAFGPCVVVIDEVDHALAGHNGSGDSGVMSRFFGTMQSWLNDHTSDAFVVCTSNDIRTLPAAFTRAERFDGVFYVDLPGLAQRRAIWQLYRNLYRIDAQEPLPTDSDWSGAEIKACCRLAKLLEVPLVEAAQNVVPVARTSQESVQKLREWAVGRCLAADAPGVYNPKPAAVAVKPGRKVQREPSNN